MDKKIDNKVAKKVKKTKKSTGNFIDYLMVALCIIVILVCILPILNILSRSLSDAQSLQRNEVGLFPKGINLDAYKYVLTDERYVRSLIWTIILTFICVIVSMTMTTLCAFPLIYEKLKGKRIINTFIIFTMYFNAGLIPHYLLYKDLGLLENPLVLIVPSCLSVFNMIIMKSYFFGIPSSLKEAAEIDGAGPIRTLIMIYLPLSKPVFATLALFYAVGRWNGYTDALMFLVRSQEYHPIQLHLYNILQSISSVDVTKEGGVLSTGVSVSIKAATVMFATVPIMMVYPFLQKHFIAGVTLGAIKG